MSQHEALKLALETLEQLQGGCTDSNDGTVEALTVWCPEVIDALRAALAEPAQEPAGYKLVPIEPTTAMICAGSYAGRHGGYDMEGPTGIYAAMLAAVLDAAPTPAQPAEPIAWECTGMGLRKFITDATYRRFKPAIQAWYKPFKCSSCAAQPVEPLTDAYVIDLLVAAGHVTREVVEQAREIAGGIGIKEASK